MSKKKSQAFYAPPLLNQRLVQKLTILVIGQSSLCHVVLSVVTKVDTPKLGRSLHLKCIKTRTIIRRNSAELDV